MKPFKLCRVCKKNYCISGYCSECRTKDASAATIKAREVMDREKFGTNTISAEPAGTVTIFPSVAFGECLQPGESVIIVTDGTYEQCPHCGSLILKASVQQNKEATKIEHTRI
jgi:hypothetical protein